MPQLSDNLRGLSFDTLFPVVLAGSSITRRWWPPRAASLAGYQAVKRDIEAATSRILEGALLAREAVPKASEDRFQAHYARQYVGKLATKDPLASRVGRPCRSPMTSTGISASILEPGVRFGWLAGPVPPESDSLRVVRKSQPT